MDWLRSAVPAVNKGIVVDSVLMIAFQVLGGVSSSMMSFSLPGFPTFLNYFPASLGIVLFYFIARLRKETPFTGKSIQLKSQQQYLYISLTTVAMWSCYTYSAAWVDGNLQAVLVNLLMVFIYVFSVALLGLRITRRETFASLLIAAGVFIGCWPAIHGLYADKGDDDEAHVSWFNSWYFIACFLSAVILNSLTCVFQERAFRKPHYLDEATCLFWAMVQGFIPLMMLVPMESVPEINATPNATSFVAAWENQAGCINLFPSSHFIPRPRHPFFIPQCWPSLFYSLRPRHPFLFLRPGHTS
eukprot:m.218291 g.218291  ORF g.218291 m.218291 type:complete len:301 (+) comp54117_c0_seq4:51-953(+)